MKYFLMLFFLFSILSVFVSAQHNMNKDEFIPSFNSVIKEKHPEYSAPQTKKDALSIYRPSQAVTDTTVYSYTYDNTGNLLTEIVQILINGNWQNNSKYIYTYDNNGNQGTFIFQIWQDEEWVNIFRQTYTYNNAGLVLTYIFESNENGEWKKVTRHTYEYDNNNNQSSLLAEDWDNNVWINSWKYTIEFMQSSLLESWQNNTWVNDYLTTIHYDTSGVIAYSLGEDWISGNWVYDRRFSYTYYNDNLQITIYETWYNNEWSKEYRRTYEYDDNNNIINEINELWLNNNWENDYRTVRNYVNGFLDSGHYDVWFNQSWISTRKFNYVYDSFGNAIEGHSLYFINGQWIPHTGNLKMYYNSMADVTEYFCKFVNIEYDIFTDVRNDLPEDISFNLADNYPNPFNPYTTIKYSISEQSHVSLKVYDIQGSEIAVVINEQKTAGEFKVVFNSSSLTSGVYFYKLTAAGKTKVKKMMVLK